MFNVSGYADARNKRIMFYVRVFVIVSTGDEFTLHLGSHTQTEANSKLPTADQRAYVHGLDCKCEPYLSQIWLASDGHPLARPSAHETHCLSFMAF